jgi:hypothetical protein
MPNNNIVQFNNFYMGPWTTTSNSSHSAKDYIFHLKVFT